MTKYCFEINIKYYILLLFSIEIHLDIDNNA